MPTPILHKESLIPGKTSKLVLHAPHIAQKARPGHFVMLRMTPTGERIPLTIADTDAANGTITIVYLVLGKSTALLEELRQGDAIPDVCGPLGRPTHIEKKGTVICVGGGTGIPARAIAWWALSARAARICCFLKRNSPPLPTNC